MDDEYRAKVYEGRESGHVCFADTLSGAKDSMRLPTHRRFLWYEVDSSCVIEAALQLILLHARQVLSKELEIDAKENDCCSAEV